VVKLQRVWFVNGVNNTVLMEVSVENDLRRFHPTVAHQDTWHQHYKVSPMMTGENHPADVPTV